MWATKVNSSRPLRVTHVISGLNLGGAETVLSRLVTSATDVHHDVVSLGRRSWYSGVLEQHGIAVHHLNMKTVSSGGWRRLRGILRDSDPDVVQCWMYRANLLGGLAARAERKTAVWNIRASSLGPLGIGSRLLAYAGGALAGTVPSLIINCSQRSAELHRKAGYGRAPGMIIANGYDLEKYAPDPEARAAVREELDISEDRFVVGFIGRWHPQKDIPNLLAGIKDAVDRGVKLRCLLVGGALDYFNGELATLMNKVGCGECIELLGRRSDVPRVANALDLHLLASSGAEAFPNVVAETMACGVPNVVTDIGDAGIIVDDTGWLVPASDPQALGAAIAAAYDEFTNAPGKWRSRRAAARRRIVDHYSLERMIGRYVAMWTEQAAALPSPAGRA